MTLRKNFDSFTAQHKLRDAEEEYVQAVYRFRAAEEVNAPNRITLKREMEFLDRNVRHYRFCVYSGIPIDGDYVDLSERALACCPKPAWSQT